MVSFHLEHGMLALSNVVVSIVYLFSKIPIVFISNCYLVLIFVFDYTGSCAIVSLPWNLKTEFRTCITVGLETRNLIFAYTWCEDRRGAPGMHTAVLYIYRAAHTNQLCCTTSLCIMNSVLLTHITVCMTFSYMCRGNDRYEYDAAASQEMIRKIASPPRETRPSKRRCCQCRTYAACLERRRPVVSGGNSEREFERLIEIKNGASCLCV